MKNAIVLILLFVLACKQPEDVQISPWVPYDETDELAANANHPSQKMRYKLIQSKVLDKNKIWGVIANQMDGFSAKKYEKLKPYIFEQDIPTIQSHVKSGKLTYETLTQWYLFRIVKFENDKDKALQAIISINPNAVKEARKLDQNKSDGDHPIYGIPILIKDNINLEGLPTTAGAHAFLNNQTSDAFLVAQIKKKGGIIMGKTNLSEWANYLCLGCPNGYSAVGGQTLNPYGRKKIDTGGSSSGSGVSMAANYAAAAIGTETSGSILSPSSKSSLVGLKPTVGMISRGGIVPISSTLDTPGPMTKNVIDNAILLSAMVGNDPADQPTKISITDIDFWKSLEGSTLKDLRFGVNKNFLTDSIYRLTVSKIKGLGGTIVEFEPKEVVFDGFGTFLSGDMKVDLPNYISNYGSSDIPFTSVADIVAYNQQDTLVRIPYGQARFEGILDVEMEAMELGQLKLKLHQAGARFFSIPMAEHKLDAILSVNNRNAGYAAVAKFPCLTVPMGYRENGEPAGITFIARPSEEEKLLKMGYAFEQGTNVRKVPKGYE